MTSVNPYLELLKEELIDACSQIDPSITKLRVLKKGDFERMAKIIQGGLERSSIVSDKQKEEHANTTISVSTLERLYKYGYVLQPMDKRILNTLNKWSWFLKYKGWQEFTEAKKEQYNIKDQSLEKVLDAVVGNAANAEFEAYRALPEIKTDELKKYLITTGTAYKRIYNILVQHSKKKWVINNENNPSGHTTYNRWIERVNSKEAIIKSSEYYYLRWFELPTSEYVHIYNEENVQTWTLYFEEGTWKVFSTYYPPPIPGSLK
jgi:hypothetical protein